MRTTPSDRLPRKPADSSSISFTALYTGAVWHRYGLSDDLLATNQGRWLIIDHLIEQALSGGGCGEGLFEQQRYRKQSHLPRNQQAKSRQLSN